jgi:hypothetical protein
MLTFLVLLSRCWYEILVAVVRVRINLLNLRICRILDELYKFRCLTPQEFSVGTQADFLSRQYC